ncbi:MAG: DUF3078 domain-containing protein [Bacteroidetes bacterium]|nr:MAG: DUF3078 domain-containing protein [Bacteroidota bacterium]
MKKIIGTVFVMCFAAGLTYAEDTTAVEGNWKVSGFFLQNLNQVSFTNWAAGGENSFSSTSNARINAKYAKGIISWESYLDMSYGIVKLEDTPMRKNTDKIDLFSKFGREINERLNYSAIFNFQSQFDKGYKPSEPDEVVSRFMAPGYLTVAIGLDYKPVEFLSIFLSPATGKFTFVLDDELAALGAYGVDEGKNVNPEFGALLRIEFEKEVVTNVNVNSRVILFNNYTDSDVSNRKNTDVDWIVGINMPVNKYITATIGLHLLYDHDTKIEKDRMVDGEPVVGPTTQFKQQFGMGLVYNF